jgi:hypothetical protein
MGLEVPVSQFIGTGGERGGTGGEQPRDRTFENSATADALAMTAQNADASYAARTYYSRMSVLGATILTAIATMVLAVGAVITAVLAGRALNKQSEEVRILQKQAKDATDLLEVQSDQLDVQRDQFESLRKINEKQTEVLGLQAEDLRESIKERERLRKATERTQADEITFRMTLKGFPDIAEEDGGGDFAVVPGQMVHMGIVSNGSRRPIKNVKCRIGGAPDIDLLFPKTHSEYSQERSTGSCSRSTRIKDLGLSQVTASFTDDAGLPWQIDQYQHLERLSDSE